MGDIVIEKLHYSTMELHVSNPLHTSYDSHDINTWLQRSKSTHNTGISIVDCFQEYQIQCSIYEYHELNFWYPSKFITCMVTIHEHFQIYYLPLWCRHIQSNKLFLTPMELLPITLMKFAMVNCGTCWVIQQLGTLLLPPLCCHMQHGNQMILSK